MATFNWPGFGIKSIAWTFSQPSQSNVSPYTGTRSVASNPWHGAWSAKVELSAIVGSANVRSLQAFLAQLLGSVNTFHLPAAEGPQNGNSGVAVGTSAAQGASSLALAGVTTALVAGNRVTVNGQLLQITSVDPLDSSSHTQTVLFRPLLRAAAGAGTAVETAKPYALVYLSSPDAGWNVDLGQVYSVAFDVSEAIGETDGADPSLDVWTGSIGTGGSIGGSSFTFPQLPSFTTRSLLAAVVGPTDKQVAYLTEARREGEFVFSASNLSAMVTADPAQAVYIAPASDTSGLSGAWIRQRESNHLHIDWFGAAGDGATDDTTPFVRLRTLAIALTVNIGSGFGIAPEIHLGLKTYFLASSYSWKGCSAIWRAADCNITNYSGGSVIKMASGATFTVERSNTENGSTGTTISSIGADGSEFHNIEFSGPGKGVGTAPVVKWRARARSFGCRYLHGGGHGLAIDATAGGGTTLEGNANCWYIQGGAFNDNGGSGLAIGTVAQADVNAGTCIGGTFSGNGAWGIDCQSFLSCAFFGCHTELNTAGPFRTTNANAQNLFSGCYSEGGQPPSSFVSPTLIIGGQHAAGVTGTGTYIREVLGFATVDKLSVNTWLNGEAPAWDFGPQGTTAAADNIVNFHTTNNSITFNYKSWTGGAATTEGSLHVNKAVGLVYDARLAHYFNINGGQVAYVSSTEVAPTADNVTKLGAAPVRWSQLYAGTATINTSDARFKAEIEDVSDKVLDAWEDVQWRRFKHKDAIAAKGKDGARVHVGLVAQHVRDVFAKHGIDGFAFGLLCYDEWEDQLEPVMVDKTIVREELVPNPKYEEEMALYQERHGKGKKAKLPIPYLTAKREETIRDIKLDGKGKPVMRVKTKKGSRFGLRYEEALALEAATQRRRCDRLEARLAALEARAA